MSNDFKIKKGQIAHLDQNPENIELDNLSWLCFVHHDQYDSRTSQSKNFTINEAKQYREELYDFIQKAIKSGMQLPPGDDKPSNNKSNNRKNNLRDDLTFSESAVADIDFRLSDRCPAASLISRAATGPHRTGGRAARLCRRNISRPGSHGWGGLAGRSGS